MRIEKGMGEEQEDQSRGNTLSVLYVEANGSGLCQMADFYIRSSETSDFAATEFFN